MSIVDAQANLFLDLLLGTPGMFPNPLYIGLMTAAPNFNGTGVVEPPGANGYARVAIVNNTTIWPAAASRTKKHSTTVTFPAATGGGWGTILYAGLFQSSGGADLKVFAPLSAPRVVNNTDIFRFLSTNPFQVVIPAT